MKKFFKSIGKKSPSSKGATDSSSVGATAASDGPGVGYDVREKDLPKLHKAAWTGDLAKVIQHVKKDPSALDKENRTALHLACARGHAQIVQELLSWHAKSNIGDNQARTPLLKAVECGQEECVKKLMGHSADMDAIDREGNAGLHLAVTYNHSAILRLLIRGGANVNLMNKEGSAPLHMAVRMKRDEIARALLVEKADPDIQDTQGRTPLMYACYDGSVTPVRLLLQNNVNMMIKDKKGFTAEDVANMTGQYACAQLLSDHASKMRRSGGGSIPSTPRSSTGVPSTSTTPRDPLISNMLPVANAAGDDSDEDTTFSRNSTHERGDDSWGDDSLSQADGKKKSRVRYGIPGNAPKLVTEEDSDEGADPFVEDALPKINLAAALKNTLPPDNTSDDGGDTHRDHDDDYVEEDEDFDEESVGNKQPVVKQNSNKSLQSQTSGEGDDFSDDDDEDDEGGKQKDSAALRVSFKPDSEISEIKEMTADEDTTDYDDEDSETAAKRPKLDAHQRQAETGYTPTGVSNAQIQMNLERQREGDDAKSKGALMEELGISDPEDISDPDISDYSESAPPLPGTEAPVKPQKTDIVEENPDSDWDSTVASEQPTPRPGILKNWKQHSLAQVQGNKEKANVSQKSDASEWDSDLEDELDPEKPTSIQDEISTKPDNPAQKYLSQSADNEEDSEDSDITGFTPRPKKMVEICRDGSLRGVGDSPIVLDYKGSASDISDPNIIESPKEVEEELSAMDEVVPVSGDLIEKESPYVMMEVEDPIEDVDAVEDIGGIGSPVSDDPETDKEVARVLGLEEHSSSHSSTMEHMDQVQTVKGKLERTGSQDTMNRPPSDEENSQWDSTNTEGITPRTVQNLNPVEEIRSGSETTDYLDLQPTPPSDFRGSSVEPVTSASLESSFTQPKTVVEKTPAPPANKPDDEEDEEESDWDSDDDLLPSESGAPPIYSVELKHEQVVKTEVPPQKVEEKSQSRSLSEDVDEEEESISEWEIERQKEKEKKKQETESQKLVEQQMQEQLQREADLMQQEWEAEERRKEDRLRKEAEEEAKREMEMEMNAVESDKSDEDEVKPVEAPTSPKSPERVTSPGRRELKKVHLLSVQDFVKSPESNKTRDVTPQFFPSQNVSSTPTPAVVTTTEPTANESLSPIEPEIIEAVTSFSTFAPKKRENAINHNDHKKDSDLHNSQRAPEGVPALDQNHTIEVTSFGPNRARSTPTITTTPPNMHSDGMSVEDDDSVDLDSERPGMSSFLRGLPGGQYPYSYKGLDIPDDDVLSFTSTENGDSLIYQTNFPYGKDVLANMNLSDPATVLKLQEYMHEQNKRLDHERNLRMTQDNKYRSIAKEKNELLKRVDNLTQMRSNLEQTKLDLEQKIRNLEYNFSEEAEMRKNSETLLNKTKEQLARKEEQFTSEIEAKQKAELQMRNLQIELRSATNSIKQLEDEKDDMRRQLQNEKNARQMQEQLNEDQQKMQRALQDEHVKSTTEKSEAENKLEAADEDVRATLDSLHKLRAENAAIKMEIEKQRSRHREEVAMLSTENEELQNKIEEVKNDIKLNEEALAHATMQYNLQLSNMRTETSVINSVLDKEKMAKEKLETELESLKTRLHSSMLEVDKAEQARNDAERRLQHDRDEWRIQVENKDKEVSSMKDNTQGLLQRLSVLENKLNALENELHISNTTLLERSNQLQQCQKDLQYYKSAQENFDQNYKMEKEISIKLQTKLEQVQEKMTNCQHENLTLRQQLDSTQQTLMERSGDSKAEQYNSVIASMKTDHEKARMLWEERNTNLLDQCTRLKEETRNLEARRSILEKENSKHNDQLTEMIRKLSVAEATLNSAESNRRELLEEKMKMTVEVDKYRQKLENVQEQYQSTKGKLSELSNQLHKAQESNETNTQKLLNTSANMEAFSKSKGDLEENYQKLKLENTKLEAELNHERQKSEMIQKDLQDSQKVRSSLEALCANLKSTNAHLEDKLGHGLPTDLRLDDEQTTRSLITQEAEESKDLWEKEVISRSKLGLRISQYEKQKQDAFNQLEEERRKHRKALEQKKVAETRLEAEIEKNTQLQKEVASLKTYLKVAKKRLKGVDSHDTRFNSLTADFDRERFTMESTLSTVRQQLQDLQIQLEGELEQKDKLHSKNLQLQNELVALKRLEKSCKKLEQNKNRVEEEYRIFKNKVENSYVDREDLEKAKQEMEARYRIELNRKLADVNSYLDEHARVRERLDTSRDETEFKLKDERKKIQEENTAIRIKYEQLLAQIESKELEIKRFRDLYESEMQWRMRLSNQLMQSTDKAFKYKSKLVVERQQNRTLNNMGNLTFSGTLNGQLLDVSRFSSGADDLFQNKLKAELDRSISKHLEAAPHDSIKPVIRANEDNVLNTSFAKSNADYLDMLKRKYCV